MLSAIADSINNTRKLLTEILKFWCLFFPCGVSNLVEMFCNSKKIISYDIKPACLFSSNRPNHAVSSFNTVKC